MTECKVLLHSVQVRTCTRLRDAEAMLKRNNQYHAERTGSHRGAALRAMQAMMVRQQMRQHQEWRSGMRARKCQPSRRTYIFCCHETTLAMRGIM